MSNTTTTSTSSNIHQNVVPSEVGWQFVPQYYTYVNQQPNRLHRFYTKASTFIHGVEGEDGKPCYGQQEIHNKITSIGFQDCKVFIHSVDAQSSASGGIIIQVIGEMSNRGEEWRKFVQTFFLAEQPNGYFVLNDIFRFLKEETVESDAASDAEPVTTAPPPILTQNPPAPEPVPLEPTPPPPAPEEPEPAPVSSAPTPIPEEPLKTVIPEPVPAPAPATPAPSEPAASAPHVNGNGTAPPAPEPEPEAKPEPVPEPPTTAPEPEPAPTTVSPAPVAPPSLPPAQPPQPKTWANLAANNAKKWGAAVATESRGTSEVPASPLTPSRNAPTPVAGQGPPRGSQPRDQQSAVAAAQSITHASCFVKGVTENVSQAALTQILMQRFGPVKDVEIVRNKACAFLDFIDINAAKRAIVASLPVPLGGEGGIRIDVEGGGQARIVVETKKERGERPPSNRPMNGPGRDMRGGFRGGRGGPGGGRGRGGPPQSK